MPAEFTFDLLKKNSAHVDPDLRVMILRDFCEEIRLGKFPSFNPTEETAIVDILAERFSGYERVKDVQSEAIRTLDLVTPILSQAALAKLVAAFVKAASTEANEVIKEQRVTPENVPLLRENGCMAIRMVLKRVASLSEGELAVALVNSIVEPFLKNLSKTKKDENNVLVDMYADPAKRDYYEVIQPVLQELGQYVTPNNAKQIYDRVRHDWHCKTSHLFNQLVVINACLFPLLPEEQFKVALANLLKDLNSQRGEGFRRNLSAFIAVIRTSSSRVGGDVPQLFKVLNAELERLETSSSDDSTDDDEARASILDSLKVLVRDCPKEAEPFIDNVISVGTKLLDYDPNYCGDDSADNDNAADGGDEYGYGGGGGGGDDEYADYYGGGGDYEYDDNQADADDMSWKVRLSATALLTTLIRGKNRAGADEALKQLLAGSTPLLVKRMKDRVETVKLEMFDLLIAALELVSAERSIPFNPSAGIVQTNIGLAFGRDTNVQLETLPTAVIFDKSQSTIFNLLGAALDDKSAKVSAKGVEAFRKFLLVRGDSGLSQIPTIVADFKKLIVDDASRRKSAAILPALFQIVRYLVVRSNGDAALAELTPFAIASTADKTPAVARSAIDLVAEIAATTNNSVAQIYAAMIGLLQSSDSEIKIAAIGAVAKIISTSEKTLVAAGADLAAGYKALSALLGLDSTRRVASVAVKTVARAAIPDASVASYADQLVKVLYKADRQEREAAIAALVALVAAHKAAVSDASYNAIVAALAEPASSSTTLVERELIISAHAFALIGSVARCGKDSIVSALLVKVAPRMVEFLAKPSVQGLPVIEAGAAFFALGSCSDAGKVAEDAFAKAFTLTEGNVPIALGALVAADKNDARRNGAFDKLAAKVGDAAEGVRAAMALGEAGRFISLSSNAHVVNAVFAPAFKSEDIAAAVTAALSKATSTATGSATFSVLLQKGTSGTNNVATRALRSSIADGTLAPLSTHPLGDATVFKQALAALTTAVKSNLDLVEAQEALGQLAAWSRADVYAALDGFLNSGNEELIAAAGYSLRYTLRSARNVAADRATAIAACLKFLSSFSRPNKLPIRRSALMLLKGLLSEGMYTEAVHKQSFDATVTELSVDTTLVRIADLGVVKHRDDKGVDLRRNTFDFVRDLLASPEAVFLTEANYAAVAKATVAALGPITTIDAEEDEDIIATARKQLFVLRSIPAAWNTIASDMKRVADYLALSLKPKSMKDGVITDKKEEESIVLAIAIYLYFKREVSVELQAGPFAEKVKVVETHDLAPRARVMLNELTKA